jgi:hypothetical protein
VQNRPAADRRTGRNSRDAGHPLVTAYIHIVRDDHFRPSYCEIRGDETREPPSRCSADAAEWFAARSVRIERVISDNGSCYRSNVSAATCEELGITLSAPAPTGPDRR